MNFSKIPIAFFLLIIFFGVIGCSQQHKPVLNKKNQKQTNEELLTLVQKQTFNYFWEGAEPNSGMARERIHMDNIYPTSPKNTVTTGGSGFGFMAILVGVERKFITREQALKRFEKIINFLDNADRYHGAWPHWMVGETGKTLAFSKKDDGGDLVETAFLMQGLLSVKQYFNKDNSRENALRNKIQKLWEGVEWNWYTKGGEKVLYWHWSPNYGWDMNFPVRGYNEALIMYVLATSSPTYPISKEVYEKGWAKSGAIVSSKSYYGEKLILNYYDTNDSPIGPLFWAHYSYLGLSPKGLTDQYANYWKLVQNQAIINYKYCVANPKNYKGYGKNLWGLTSSYSINGYSSHRPDDDLSVISPTAALSSFPYTPKESMQMLKYLYKDADSLVGKYGPYDAFSMEKKWLLPRYLAIDQGPIPVMIENYRTGLLWNLFMENKEVQEGLKKLGFNSPYLKK